MPGIDLQEWGPDRRADLARLWALAAPDEPISESDLGDVVFGDGGVALATGDALVAVRLGTGERARRGNVALIAVHPDRRRSGRGAALLSAAERWLAERGAEDVNLGAGIPRYLWPGVDVHNLGAHALALSAGYTSIGCEVNMLLTTGFRAPTPRGVEIGLVPAVDVSAVDALVGEHWPVWRFEVTAAASRGALFTAWVDGEPVGFFGHSGLRSGWIGPAAVLPEFRRQGVAAALLARVCEDLEARGRSEAEIPWVGPVGYFADHGARISRVFRRFTKRLA